MALFVKGVSNDVGSEIDVGFRPKRVEASSMLYNKFMSIGRIQEKVKVSKLIGLMELYT